MQIGDQIYSINGVSVENLTEDQILRFRKGGLIFSRDEDESITLEVQISGKRPGLSWPLMIFSRNEESRLLLRCEQTIMKDIRFRPQKFEERHTHLASAN